MIKMIFKNTKLILIIFLLFSNILSFYFFYKTNRKLKVLNYYETNYSEIINVLNKESVFKALENDLGFSEQIAFKITDGSNKYIFIQKIYLIDNLEFYPRFIDFKNREVSNIFVTCSIVSLSQSNHFILLKKSVMNQLKKNYKPCIKGYNDFITETKLFENYSLKKILSTYFVFLNGKYKLNNKKLFNDKCSPDSLIAYLYFKFGIVTSVGEWSYVFINPQINPQLKKLAKK